MLIIVEGPDGAGKSTFVEALDRALWKGRRGCVLVNHKAAPRRPALEEYARDLSFYRPGGDVDLVLDRSWWSEEVYGPRWRGQPLPPFARRYLNGWAASRGALVVFLDAPDEVLVERVCGSRGDDLVSDPEEVVQLAADYRHLASQAATDHVVRYTWPYSLSNVVRAVVERASRLDDLAAPLAAHPSYVGPLRPDVLLLGDRLSDTADRRGFVTAFPPYPGSAAQQVLWPAVEALDRHTKVGVANAYEGDPQVLVAALHLPKVVCLGREAFNAYGAPMAPHPQYVKRFFYGRRVEYASALHAALDRQHALDYFGPADPARREESK